MRAYVPNEQGWICSLLHKVGYDLVVPKMLFFFLGFAFMFLIFILFFLLQPSPPDPTRLGH
jgi:hypothetical protein